MASNARCLLMLLVFSDEQLKQTELTSKLEPAFLSGLRCNQPHIRAKFFKVFDESMRRRLHDRLLYITCSQNWDAIGPHYWIKQCIELLLVTAAEGKPIQMSHESSILPNIAAVINSIDPKEKKKFLVIKLENHDVYETDEIREEVLDMDLSNVDSNPSIEEKPTNRSETISKLITKDVEFIEVSKNVTTDQFLVAAAQLCHMDTALAEQVWLQLFPKLWAILDEQQRSVSILNSSHKRL